ncbi:MAG: hypothetical protein N2490_04805 [Ignavibacteria bacterium]|nr:hypothetical protein [Ignavibacteria bacterium]
MFKLKVNSKTMEKIDKIKAIRWYCNDDKILDTIENENLCPDGLLNKLHYCYREHSNILRDGEPIFKTKNFYSGLSGFKEIIEELNKNGIDIGDVREREFFIEVYRFLATKHALNAIDWRNYQDNSIYHLIIPQPNMIKKEEVQKYLNAKTEEERMQVVKDYQKKTNPHDGKQKLNKPWYIDDNNRLVILDGCQHKYPPINLILDKTTQSCFAFCTYCFRHAQVRGDEDMFVQESVQQVLDYLKRHKEITDILITGGDAAFLPYDRLREYVIPIVQEEELSHIRNVRFGSRVLTYHPEFILNDKFKEHLDLMRYAIDNGVQVVWVSHFSTPREILNPLTISAIRRLKSFGLTLKNQSPIMKHVSLFLDENGKVDIDKSAQNWIDLGNILAMLGIGFHSMYCARPTGEYHYFTAPLADIVEIFNKVFRELASINRPSRFITMTFSSGKISLLGTTHINNEKVFVLRFNEARNMKWMDKIFFAKFSETETSIENLEPYDADEFFYKDELRKIEKELADLLEKEKYNHRND